MTEGILRISTIAATIALLFIVGAAPASAEWLVTTWRPAIDGIGNAEPPAIEGVAGIPDGVDFNPSPPRNRGMVTIDDTAPTPPATLHLRRHRIVIER